MRNTIRIPVIHEIGSDDTSPGIDACADTVELEALSVASSEPVSTVLVVADVEHPTLIGRVRCVDLSGARERWLPTLRGLSIRVGDRVLVNRPTDFAESIVVGVLDGFAPRERPLADSGPRLSLLPDQALRIETKAGAPICEVRATEDGPVVRLLSSDLTVETEGHLRFSARSIELEARQGSMKLEASDDVVVQGETIQLN